MADKKIIDKKDVKENNPNDDEEILKNNPDIIPEAENENEDESNDTNEKSQGNETIGIP